VVGAFASVYIERARPGTDIFGVAKAWITAYFCMTMSSNIIFAGELLLVIVPWLPIMFFFPLQQERSLRGYSLPGPMTMRGRIREL
jgi:hypothetical protein